MIGVVPPDLPLAPHEHEVADWFEAPLALSSTPPTSSEEAPCSRAVTRHYYEIMWDEPQDLGGNRGDDRQSFAQAAMELKLDAAKWRKRRGMRSC